MWRVTGTAANAKEPRASSVVWFESGEADANDTEVLFFALLLVSLAMREKERAALDSWAAKVLAEAAAAFQLRAQWQPSDGWGKTNKVSKLFDPMARAYGCQRSAEELDTIGKAIQSWHGAGQFNGLCASRLQNHWRGKTFGFRRSKKLDLKSAPPRWRTWQICSVAELVAKRGAALRSALRRTEDTTLTTDREALTVAKQQISAVEAEREQLRQELGIETAAAARLADAFRKAKGRLAAKRTAVSDARAAVKAKASQSVKVRVMVSMMVSIKQCKVLSRY